MKKMSIVEQLKPFAPDAVTYGRLYADFHDLVEACEWFLTEINEKEGRALTPDEIENFLIEVDVQFIEHVTFHLTSLRKDLNAILANFPDEANDN